MRLSWHCGGILVLPSTKIALIQHHWQLSEHNCQFKVTYLTRSGVELLLLPFAILLHSPSALKLSSITPSVYSGWQLNFWFIYGCSSWSGKAAPAQTFTRTTRRYFEHAHTHLPESLFCEEHWPQRRQWGLLKMFWVLLRPPLCDLVNLAGRPLLWRFTTVPSSLHLWIMAVTMVTSVLKP